MSRPGNSRLNPWRLGIPLGLVLAGVLPASPVREIPPQDRPDMAWWRDSMASRDDRLSWWREARFGMFIHWGVYSHLGGVWEGEPVRGYAEHIQRMKKIPIPVYRERVAGAFNPMGFDADEWVRVAEQAGMGYLIITAKHHDGFAMYDSAVSDYNVVKATPRKRDPMHALREACRKRGLKFGFYYSHAFDWGEKDGPGNDWDYANPGGDLLLHGADWWLSAPEILPRVRRYVDQKSIPQVRELIRNYDPDIMWFDTPHKLPPEENLRILRAAREAKPSLVINGRVVQAVPGGPAARFGDYLSTTDKPAEFPPHNGDWEAIPTTNESYGWHSRDDSHKTPAHFIDLLAKAAARGGNVLLNLGPRGDGTLDPKDVSILKSVGAWMRVNGASIRGTTRSPLPVQSWGESTLKDHTLYLHVLQWPKGGQLVVGGLRSHVKSAYLLADPSRAPLAVERLGDKDVKVALSEKAPDAVDTVVVLELSGKPEVDPARLLDPRRAGDTWRAFDARLVGSALRFGSGKPRDAYVQGWSQPGDSVRFKARLNEAATFEVAINYDAPKESAGGAYTVKIGSHHLGGTVQETPAGALVLGRVTLAPGVFEVSVEPVSIKGGELMRLRSLTFTPVETEASSPLRLWYRQPATQWDHGLPLGNGRLGAVVFGGLRRDRIQLNENSLWMGGPKDRDNPEALAHLPEVRRLLFAGQPRQAAVLAERKLMGRPHRLEAYQTLGDLRLEFEHEGTTEDYRRELDLETAVSRTSYRVGGVRYTREVFVSAPSQVVVVRLTADAPGRISTSVSLDRSQDARTQIVAPDRIDLVGGLAGGKGLAFQASLKILTEGGRLEPFTERIAVEGADAVTLLLTAATSFRGKDPAAENERHAAAATRPYDRLRADHVADHQRLMSRVSLRLGPAGEDPLAGLPTDERLTRVQKGERDPGLDALYFQFGRYLLIASSRPGGLPANLQGLWNDLMAPPWDSDYHLNINLQMNYWPAEVTNLAELHVPLFDFLETLRAPGRKTARVHYGARGFVAHHITDVWGFTAPGDMPRSGLWPMGAAWLSQHLFEHYRFSLDREFLARAYPVMKEAAEFFLDYLVEDPQGRLVTGPSVSPENRYLLPNGNVGILCMGPSMDSQILYGLFSSTAEAASLLGADADFRERLLHTRSRLPAPRIGRHGQIQEWSEDYEEPDPGHRHISQLFALHPGDQITPRGSPELAQAARATLERRLAHGGGHTGWSRAWIVNFWARLEDGAKAYENYQALLAKSTLPNLWDVHPPFQIDGNFGGTAGVAEMLLQSHAGEIQLLPALPDAWSAGAFRGLRARGGVVVDVEWKGGLAVSANLHATASGTHRVRAPLGQKVLEITTGGQPVELIGSAGGETQTVALVAGHTYAIRFAPRAK
jgi:alpha-L-fucosidase 2